MTRHAQAAHRARRPPPLDYTGRRHARITKSMKALPPTVLCILTELRYRIEDGQTLPISIATLAQHTGQCKSYVSVTLRWLAGEAIPYYGQFAHPPRHIFIERRPRSDGMPGFEITMLPPPELRPRPARSFFGVHDHEPLPHRPASAPECAETPQNEVHASEPPLFLVHAENQLTNQESTPNMIEAGGGAPTAIEEAPLKPPADTPAVPLALQTIPPACDEIHQDQLAPELIAGHQALNPERPILQGEWWELLEMQAAHGAAQLLIWQARAARRAAGSPSRVLPGYYRACAAHAAVDAYRPRRDEAAPAPEQALAPSKAPSAPTPAPRPQLDPACDALLQAMGIRERAQLAQVPFALIEQWAAAIEHDGLAARFDDPLAFAHRQLRLQQPPPARAELDRWAERAHSRAASMSPPALTDAQVQTIRERHAATLARAAAIAPDDLADEERLSLLADLERGMTDAEVLERLHERRAVVPTPEPTPELICHAILEHLQQPIHRHLHPLLNRIALVSEGDMLRIVCTQVGDLGVAQAELAPHIRAALRSYAWQPSVRVIAQAPPPALPTSEPQPPAWIAPERWATLPGLLRTMLLGSTVDDGALRCVTPGLTAQAQARYGEVVAALLAERAGEADDAAR